jgi:hypothetical protein
MVSHKSAESKSGTAKGNGFERRFALWQVAPVIAVGYSSMKHEWRSRKGCRGFLSIGFSGPGKSQVTGIPVRVQFGKCAQGGRNHGDAEDDRVCSYWQVRHH